MYKILAITVLLAFSVNSFGQWGGSIQNHYKNKVKNSYKRKGKAEGQKHIDEQANKGLDEADKGIQKYEDWEEKEFADEKVFIDTNVIENSQIQWQRLRFVSGNKIIFYDKPFNFEENEKAPSNWYINEKSKGTTEISDLDEGKIIVVSADGYLTPKIANSENDYLPDNFTIEFDFMMPVTPFSKPMNINLYAIGKQDKKGFSQIKINKNKVSYKDSSAYYPVILNEEDNASLNWYRFSLSFDKGLIKIYLNERLMVSYNDEINPTGFSVDYFAYTPIFFKNFMIATDKVSVVDQVYAGGYTSYNINYLSYKNRLAGRSISDLSKIANLLKADPSMKMDVDVYFSQFEKENENTEMGQAKAKAVEDALVAMGVGKGQITVIYKGAIVSKEGSADNKKSEMVVFKKK